MYVSGHALKNQVSNVNYMTALRFLENAISIGMGIFDPLDQKELPSIS
jgi:hypothetical protein